MEYHPEWKLYLWKKLLINNEGFDKSDVMVVNFMFFSEHEQLLLKAAKNRGKIDGVLRGSHNLALARRAVAESEAAGYQSYNDDYYSSDPRNIMQALVELMDSKPHALSITAHLHKQYIERYRRAKSDYEVLQRKKHLASIGVGHGSGGPYKPNPNYMNDPFCGLGESIYKKAEAGQPLTSDEFRRLAGIKYAATHDCLVMKMKLNKPALRAMLDAYVDDFASGNLVAPHGVQYFDASRQRVQVYSTLQVMTQSFGVKNLVVTPERIAQYAGWTAGDEKYYRIFETLFSLEKTGNITIHELRKGEVILSLVTASEAASTTSSADVSPSPDDEVKIQTQHGPLTLNKRTGDFEYGSVKENLNPTSQEYKALLRLMTSKNCQATYSELLGGNVTKVSKMSLADMVKKLKMALGILPAATAVNEDIIDNVKNLGYKLLI